MMWDEPPGDPVMRALSELPRGRPDALRSARTSARCLAVLERQRRRAVRHGRASPRRSIRRALEPALVAGASLGFLTEVLVRALRGYR